MNQDHRIDSVLKVLTRAEAPDGLEQRILRRLEAQPVKLPQGRRWLIAACALGACASVALVVGTRLPGTPPVTPGPVVENVEKLVTAPNEASMAPRKPVSPRSPRHGSLALSEVSYPAPPAPLTEQERLLVRLAQARERQATQEIEIASASSKPKDAEVPLTHEEKLLVAVSHVRQDAVIDALDPVRRAEADARQKREFNAYVRQKDGGS